MSEYFAVPTVVVLIVLVALVIRESRRECQRPRPVPQATRVTVEAYFTCDGIQVYQQDRLVAVLDDSAQLQHQAQRWGWIVEWGRVPDPHKVQVWYGSSRTAVR